RTRRPLLGYALVSIAATLWAVNGTVSKIILRSGPSTWEVAQLRVSGAALVLVLVLALLRRDLLRVTRRELPLLALFGVAGLAAAVGATLAFALYLLIAERAVTRRHPVSLLAFGLLFASLFWAIAQPLWTFPFHDLTRSVSLQGHLHDVHLPLFVLALSMVVLGTVVPFAFLVSALEHVSATSAGLVAMLEPVVATLVAHVWLGETLTAVQLAR